MGYRDDNVALESRCQAFEQDRERLQAELAALTSEHLDLQQEVRRRRWRLRGHLFLAWAGRHKPGIVMLLIAILVPSYCSFKNYAKRVWTERNTDLMMRKLGCFGWLQIASEPTGAAVLLDEHKIGETPHRQRICPGGHLVRLVEPGYYAWQQLVQMPARGELGLQARLYPVLAQDRPPGTLILSEPSSSLVFLNDAEVGRTPFFVPADKVHPGFTVSVAQEGYRPVRVSPDAHETLWFSLARDKEPDGRSR